MSETIRDVQDSLRGSIFDTDESVAPKARHWKRVMARRVYPYALVLFDVLLIVALFSLVVGMRYSTDVGQALGLRILAALLAGSVIGVYLVGGYNYQTSKKTFRFISEHIIVSTGVFIAVFFVIYVFVAYGTTMNKARSATAFVLVAFPTVSIFYRFGLSRIKSSLERGNALCIIGSGDAARDIYRRLLGRAWSHEIIVVDPENERVGRPLVENDPNSPVVEHLDLTTFDSSIRGKYVESYVVAKSLTGLPEQFAKRLIAAQFNGNRIYTYESFLSSELKIIPPSELSLNWALSEGFRLNRSVTYDRIKRLSDIISASVGLVLLSPVILVTALAVRLTSRGPVIFRQTRVGKKESPFTLNKFRTMTVGSENGSKYTAENDTRLTRIGKFLRKTRIDELPQLWNVLKGDMSLIGPRAEWVELVNDYEQKFPCYHFRHAVKPGITGWAQVNYSYGQNDADTLEKLNYDLYYVRRYSLVLDVTIFVKTVYIVLFGRGQ